MPHLDAKEQREPNLDGLVLLTVFGLAALVGVTAIWLLGRVGGWWLLFAVMALHLCLTALVVGLSFRLASEGAPEDRVQ